MITFYLALTATYALYFHWLVSTDAQASMHAYELAALDPHKHKQGMTVNDYFFNNEYED